MLAKLLIGLTLCFGVSFVGDIQALACSCIRKSFVAPTEETKDVPANTRIWFFSYGAATIKLEDSSGKSVPGASKVMSGLLGMNVFTPAELLTVGHSYRAFLVSDYDGDGDDDIMEETEFTVSKDLETAVPSMVQATLTRTYVSGSGPMALSSCGVQAYGSFSISEHFLAVARVSPFLEIGVSNPAFPFTAGVSGFASAEENEIFIGKSGCFNSWPQAAPGAAGDVSIGAFDLAGNFSGWSEPIHLELSQADHFVDDVVQLHVDDLVESHETPIFGCQRTTVRSVESSAAGFTELLPLVLLFFLFGIVSRMGRR